MKMKIRKWSVLFLVAAGVFFSAGQMTDTFTVEAAAQESETEAPGQPEAPSEEEMPIPEEKTSKTETPSFSVSGNGQLSDDISGDNTKQFLTIQTKNGTTFFMVLDRSSNKENVYMLSMIDENDLAEFIQEAKKSETPSVVLPETETTSSTEEQKKEPKKKADDGNKGTLLVIALLIICSIACCYYVKIMKPKKVVEDAEDENLEFYDEEPYINEDEETTQENPDDEIEE